MDNPGKARFEIEQDGEVAAFLTYKLSHNGIAFLHTETAERFRGKGLAAELVREALDSARERGLDVLPFCPFVRSWIGEHPSYIDLVPASRRAEFEL
jgi:uncharacterized protein